jgi:hypothetical protein
MKERLNIETLKLVSEIIFNYGFILETDDMVRLQLVNELIWAKIDILCSSFGFDRSDVRKEFISLYLSQKQQKD